MGEDFLHFPVDFLTVYRKTMSFHVFNFVFISEEKDLSADFFFFNFLNFHNIEKFFCIVSSLMSKKI